MFSTFHVDPYHSAASRLPSDLAVGEAASYVVDHMMGDGMSVIDPGTPIWTVETAEALRRAVEDDSATTGKSVWETLNLQLTDQPREVILLAAEIVFLRDLPNRSITATKKLEDVTRILSCLRTPVSLPDEMRRSLGVEKGSFAGGVGYNQRLWKQIPWFARFVGRWAALSEGRKDAARRDPWEFHKIVMDDRNDVSNIRNALLFLVFPKVFEPISSMGHKCEIRNALAGVIDGATGDDQEAIDQDLLAIRLELFREMKQPIEWYRDPLRARWQHPKAVKTEQRAWLTRTGPDGQATINEWLGQGYVSLAAAHIKALEAGATKEQVHAQVESGYEHVEYAQRRALVEDYHAFLSLMHEGDAIIARRDDRAWVGRIAGEPYFTDEAPRLRRRVSWNRIEVPIEALPPETASLSGSPRLIVDLARVGNTIEALFDGDTPIELTSEVTLPRATDELAAEVHISTAWLDEYIDLLESRRQLIVYGPPGTGKTFIARKVARHVAGENVRIVQFHPSYSYEDFFEGLRPVVMEGSITYAVMPGPLILLAEAAQQDPDHPYVLIIDEINRADIAKVFGELYYLLEYRGDKINLQYSPEKEFLLPKNLYFIGTMNTADRSIALVDAAIRRRFPFIEMHPSEEPVSGVLASYLQSLGHGSERADLLVELNNQLDGRLRDFQIGPSYLMRDEAATDEGLRRIWRHDILPLLEEQLFAMHDHEQIHANFSLEAIRGALLRRRQAHLSEGDDRG